MHIFVPRKQVRERYSTHQYKTSHHDKHNLYCPSFGILGRIAPGCPRREIPIHREKSTSSDGCRDRGLCLDRIVGVKPWGPTVQLSAHHAVLRPVVVLAFHLLCRLYRKEEQLHISSVRRDTAKCRAKALVFHLLCRLSRREERTCPSLAFGAMQNAIVDRAADWPMQ